MLTRDKNDSKHPAGGGSSLPERAKFGTPHGACTEIQNSASYTLCPPSQKICLPSFIDVGPAVWKFQVFENVVTARTHGRADT